MILLFEFRIKILTYAFYTLFILLSFSCQNDSELQVPNPDLPALEKVNNDKTNIHFSNKLPSSFKEPNGFYHPSGGGVGIGDINNDGLQDIILVANQGRPGIFLNKHNFEFEDISEKSGIIESRGWKTGVSMIDINGDDYIDIYISKGSSVDKKASHRKNELYINNGDNTFTERAEEYGIASTNITIQSLFFDVDLDGDLDLYLVNQTLDDEQKNKEEIFANRLESTEKKSSDIFYLNEGGVFKDASKRFKITNKAFGTSIGVSDISGNGYPDLYITNNSNLDNFLYINGNGKNFIETLSYRIKHCSFNPSSCDIADINNDGDVDILEVDANWQKEYNKLKFEQGQIVPQYKYNSLSLQRTNGLFSDVAQLANVANTEFNNSTLLFDIDDDGFKDIIITNGLSNEFKRPNVAFRNQKDGTFQNKSKEWNFGDESISNGVAYGDLDNDGDLDLVINNTNSEPWIYKNNSMERGINTINFRLEGSKFNRNGIGAKVKIHTEEEIQYVENYTVRGFASSCQPLVHFGLGNRTNIDSLEIIWPDDSYQIINSSFKANKTYTLNHSDAIPDTRKVERDKRIMNGASRKLGFFKIHEEKLFDDFANENFLPHKLSQLGPCLATGDINGDGIEDVFIGGAANSPAQLYMSDIDLFKPIDDPFWESEKKYEDIGAEFFDADNDGDLDLYVTSGSNEFKVGSNNYEDRLYLNNGDGIFTKSKNKIPKIQSSTSVVKSVDIDNDGDLDLFVGGRLIPGKYPNIPESYILINEDGIFKNETNKINEDIQNIGMVTSAIWSDYDKDGDKDLLIAGEWMGIKLFQNNKGKLKNISEEAGLSNTEGWWFTIQEIDFDQDGDKDFVCGNIGLNYKVKPSIDSPLYVYSSDINNSGSLDILIGQQKENGIYPIEDWQRVVKNLPFIKEVFPTEKAFQKAQVKDIIGDKFEDSFFSKATLFASIILENVGGKFEIKTLPYEAQFSAIQGVEEYDFNQDGNNDLLMAGNMFNTNNVTPQADANYGLLLLGDGEGNYTEHELGKSGFYVPGDVRAIKMINFKDQKVILVANNNGRLQSFITDY